ncbi:methyl-accepting chemotaxis protein [Methylobacterium sp. J-048]|uniref:methyl-accepting chemotaxis protein n=1 Tax=Methylobacterium sp. J-048 TaxID=2836635 RepID=UPI001FBA6F67|nr:methyl-accepting chemotaxis protein [Methylobacterium sp. J-048]MCJ2059580.1 methyl-accepting chemotaxis protein [Methylobacterium sp. J-048]
MIADRIGKVRAVNEASIGIAADLERDVVSGRLTRDAAIADFRKRLNAMRFDGDNFVAAYGWDGINIAQPIKPEFVGKNMIDLKDAAGTPLVRRWIEIARSGTPGTMRYPFAKAGLPDPQPKIGHIQAFAPWQMFVISGVYIDDVDAEYWKQAQIIGAISGTIILVVALLGLACWLSIAKGLSRLTQATTKLANNDFEIAIPGTNRTDEIGAIARAIDIFRRGLIERRSLTEAQLAAKEIEGRRSSQIGEAMQDFEASFAGVRTEVDAAAADLSTTARSLMDTAAATATQSSTVATAAEHASGNVETVAAAAEELGSSVMEIGRQADGSATLVRLAVAEADETRARVQALNAAVSRIGDVVGLISTIAGQTNLLALNATIEAARAGEAGRGFAVVASEVKDLAGQTAKATEEITAQIGHVQASTDQAATAIEGITARIREINSVATSIAAAVEQQGAATQEIVRNVSRAAERTAEVTSHSAGLADSAEETGTAATRVLGSASELSRQSEHLAREVVRFLATVRAA